jgi:hypothetical protein
MQKKTRLRRLWIDTIFVMGAAFGAIAYEANLARSLDENGTTSFATLEDSTTDSSIATITKPTISEATGVCEAIKNYPKQNASDMSFKTGSISNVCKPFVRQARGELDRCGSKDLDPYTSHYTWPSRNQLSKKGKGNLFLDPELKSELDRLPAKIEAIRNKATDLCCGPGDTLCRTGMAKVEVEVCKPSTDPTQPDPCVFGGSFHMPGSAYRSIFEVVAKAKGEGAATEMRSIALRNLSRGSRAPAAANDENGKITLSSYVPFSTGIAAAEPVLLHEFGHACSMVRMRDTAMSPPLGVEGLKKAMRATEWIDSARKRCDANFKIPDATFDFWNDIGESRELAQCINDLAGANQRNEIDKPCNGLCPGHYVEEAVGIAFSLMLGELKDGPASILPNTCDHVRDGQHPLVSDIVECFAQHSPKFRERVKTAYGCGDTSTSSNLARVTPTHNETYTTR